jgi:hypothetical protein
MSAAKPQADGALKGESEDPDCQSRHYVEEFSPDNLSGMEYTLMGCLSLMAWRFGDELRQ